MSQVGPIEVAVPSDVARTFIADVGSAVPIASVINFFGDATQGISSSAAGNTVTYTVADATTSQKGVVEYATLTETIDGSSNTLGTTPAGVNAKIGNQTTNSIAFGQGATNPIGWTNALTNGQLIIGSTAGSPDAANLTSTGGTIAITNGPNSINLETGVSVPTTFTTNSGNATPIANVLNILGDTEFITTSGATNVVTADITENFEETGMHGWNGALLETTSVSITSDGATITLSVEQSGGGDLTAVFSDGYDIWDTTPADTVTLTAGIDTAPQDNYTYYLQSTKTLTNSTIGFPSAEHVPIATSICQSAASLQTDGPYKQQNWTDHVVDTDSQGHLSHLNFWIRQQNATYNSGVTQTYTITTNGGVPDNVTIETIAGIVLQLHENTFPAFSNPIDYYVVNDSVTPYNVVTDLNALLTDSTGGSMSGRYFSLVLWGAVNSNGESKMFINLPSGSYTNTTNLTEDASKFATFTVPSDFKGVGFLISQWNLRHQVISGGTWTSIDEIDLRGFIPNTTAGGTNPFPNTFPDNLFRIFDDGDDTKNIAFEASSITTATTRTLTVQDSDGTIALTSDFSTALPLGNTVPNTVAATSVAADNLFLDGNTLSSTDTNGDINLQPNGTGLVTIGTSLTGNYISQIASASGQWINFNDQTDSFGIYNNAGTPEAVVAANTGSLGIDTSTPELYLKTTDTVNTGWESFVHPFIDETTFTPVLEFGGGTTGITYAAQVGRVWQVGMFKFLQINIVLTSKGSSTGVATITGVSTAATRTCFFNTRWSLINLAASYSTTICLISASTVTLQQVGDNVAFVDLTNAEFANTSQLFFTGIYI